MTQDEFLCGCLRCVTAAAAARAKEAAPTTRHDVLARADRLVSHDRQDMYGPPDEHFAVVAGIWSLLLKVEVSPLHVPMLLAALKLARAAYAPGVEDSWVDLAGYAALAAELATQKNASEVAPCDAYRAVLASAPPAPTSKMGEKP